MKEDVLTSAHPMTVEEYIDFEERSEIRHEFIHGTLYPILGTTTDHNDICFNLKSALKQLLKNLRMYTESVKVQVNESDYTYPDLVVAPDERDLSSKYIIRYPSVIFEVISKTSRLDDTVDKFIRYKNIASLQNYILVDSEKQLVEVRTKLENGDWEAATYLPSDIRFPVPALGVELTFEGVYEGVHP